MWFYVCMTELFTIPQIIPYISFLPSTHILSTLLFQIFVSGAPLSRVSDVALPMVT